MIILQPSVSLLVTFFLFETIESHTRKYARFLIKIVVIKRLWLFVILKFVCF